LHDEDQVQAAAIGAAEALGCIENSEASAYEHRKDHLAAEATREQ
jgi:hypothetical protein